ncbi:MAG TPA: tannase/feruloyl esterase family alpha/beta hydrolase [Pseudonocardiaceae bacterium]
MSWTRVSAVVAAAVLGTVLHPGTADAGTCTRADRIRVPGAEHQVVSCLDDLTTAGTVRTGHTDPADWAGLHASGTRNPSGVPGVQVDGYFPDTSTSNTLHGWNHDSQFVIRLPRKWNGKLVVTGAPGVRRQYSLDYTISDWVVARGYAFAATDKGNGGAEFFTDGTDPGDAVAEWNHRVTQLTVAAKQVVRQYYGHAPRRTYMTGISNGGYLTRWQLENHPELYDGGVDWEGTLWTAEGPNLFTYLPTALREYPKYAAGDPAAHQVMLDAGFAPGSEPTWEFHHQYYWDVTQRIYREEFDPDYDGDLQAGIPFCQETQAPCDAGYEYADRPRQVVDAVRKVELTGRIGRPMITLHGTLDALLPIATDSDVYARMIDAAGRSHLHRYYRLEGGTHVDSLHDALPDVARPILPCYRKAFEAMERWVERGKAPAPGATVPWDRSRDPLHSC